MEINLFSGTPDGNNQTGFINHEQDEGDLSSTSSGAEDKAEADSILNITGSPMITVGKIIKFIIDSLIPKSFFHFGPILHEIVAKKLS